MWVFFSQSHPVLSCSPNWKLRLRGCHHVYSLAMSLFEFHNFNYFCCRIRSLSASGPHFHRPCWRPLRMDPEPASYILGLTATNSNSTCPELLLLGPCSQELCRYLSIYLEKKPLEIATFLLSWGGKFVYDVFFASYTEPRRNPGCLRLS